MKSVIRKVATHEGLNVPDELMNKIIIENLGNMRGAILALQSCRI